MLDCKWFFRKADGNAAFVMVFPESTRGMLHCRCFFSKADVQIEISRDFFRKQTWNCELHVCFSESTREMEHCAFALEDFPLAFGASREKRGIYRSFLGFQS